MVDYPWEIERKITSYNTVYNLLLVLAYLRTFIRTRVKRTGKANHTHHVVLHYD